MVFCQANYCRSPVAEKIINNSRSKNTATSSGLTPFPASSMDNRSSVYLEGNFISDLFHNPKRTNKQRIIDADIIICFEINILKTLSKKYKKYQSKIKIYNFIDQNIMINDPYKFKSISDYENEMQKIKELCLKWDNFL